MREIVLSKDVQKGVSDAVLSVTKDWKWVREQQEAAKRKGEPVPSIAELYQRLAKKRNRS